MYGCLGCTCDPEEKKNHVQKIAKNGRFWEENENRKIAVAATVASFRVSHLSESLFKH